MDEITVLSPDLETIRSTQEEAVATFNSLFQ